MKFRTILLNITKNRSELIAIIKQIYKSTGLSLPKLEEDNEPIDVDPFTVFGLFNKGITDDILNKNDLKYWVLSSKINYELERNFKKMDRLRAVHIGGKSYKVIGCPDYDDNLLHEATVEECEDCSFFVKYIQDNGYVICLRKLFESQYGLNNEKRIRKREESSYTTQDIGLWYSERSNTDLGTKKIRCIICNRVADESEFWTYWGDNVGCCNNVECKNKYFEMQDQSQRNKGAQKKEHVCPICGSPLVLRTARKGVTPGKQFYGCSGFPNCSYTENI